MSFVVKKPCPIPETDRSDQPVPKKTRSAKADRVAPNAVKKSRPSKKPNRPPVVYPDYDATFRPDDAIVQEGPDILQPSRLHYRDDARGLWLYHGDCLEVMDTLRAKHPDGVFDMIFADPPYFLSNGGITCHAGKMVKVDKGDWAHAPDRKECETTHIVRCETEVLRVRA